MGSSRRNVPERYSGKPALLASGGNMASTLRTGGGIGRRSMDYERYSPVTMGRAHGLSLESGQPMEHRRVRLEVMRSAGETRDGIIGRQARNARA